MTMVEIGVHVQCPLDTVNRPNSAIFDTMGTTTRKRDLAEGVKEIFSNYLLEKGQRKTPERFAILEEIYAWDEHFDIDSLYARMKSKEFRVSRATLYNTMELLLDSGLVRKHQFGNAQAQFEKSHHFKQHDHIIMTDSGEVVEFCDPRIENIKATLEDIFDIDISHHSLYFYAKKRQS